MQYQQSILDKIAEKRRASRPKSARQRVLEEVRSMPKETIGRIGGQNYSRKRDMTNMQGFDMDFYNKLIQIYP